MLTSEWPDPYVSQTSHFIRRQAEFLQRAGVQLTVVAFRGAKSVRNYMRAWKDVRQRLRQQTYDLIHAQFGQSGLLALPKKLPLVVTMRGSDVLGIVRDRDGRQSLAGRILKRASRLVARSADAVILVAPHLGDGLKTRAPAYVIPSGLDLSLFRPMSQTKARRKLGFDGHEKLILFVGRPATARKRFALAEQAVELLKTRMPARLVVAWSVSHRQVPVYMNACDALIFTSMQEGSPNVVKEALACNLPVVSVKVGDVPERLQGIEGCEVCADHQPETIAAALERVLTRGTRIKGVAAVRQLDEKLMTRKVISVYRTVLRRSRR
jgi:glycosyltransferase involved in cell wall biosynthesis